MSNSKITTPEAISVVLTVFIAHTLVSKTRTLLIATKSATILNLIYVGIIAILLVVLAIKLLKKFPSADILDVSEYLGGKIFKKVIGFIFICYFIFNSSILIRNFSECLRIVYYPMTNIAFILLTFITAVCIVNYYSIQSASKVNLIILPIVLFSIIFIFIANFKNFSIENMYPILGEGFYNTFISGLGNLGAFGGLSVLYFLPPYLKEPEKLNKIAITSFVIAVIYLILCVGVVLFMLPFLTQVNEVLPLYTASRYIEFGAFFQRLESIFLLIWIVQMICYLSIILHICMIIFKKITNIENYKPLVIPFGFLVFSVALLPVNYGVSNFLENVVYKYLILGIQFIMGISILALANLKRNKKKGASIENE